MVLLKLVVFGIALLFANASASVKKKLVIAAEVSELNKSFSASNKL